MSNSRHRVATNTLVQLVGKAITTASSLAITILIGRFLGISFYSDVTKVIATSLLFYTALDFGINAVIVKRLKKNPQDLTKEFQQALGLRLIIACFLYLLTLTFLLLSPTPNGQGYTLLVKIGIALMALQYFTQAITLNCQAIFQNYLEYYRGTIAVAIGSLIQLSLIILTIHTSPSLNNIILAHLSGYIVVAVVALLLVKPHLVSLTPRFSWQHSHPLLRTSLPIGIALVFNLLSTRIDTIILGLSRPTLEVGYYGLGHRFFEVLLVVPSFFMNAAYPVLLEKQGHSLIALRQASKKIFLFLFLSGTLLAIASFLTAPLIIIIRPDFAPAIIVLKILSCFLPIFFITSAGMWILIATNHQHHLSWIYFATFAFNSVINIVTIPRFGYVAPAITTGITEVIVLVLSTPFVLQSLREPKSS